MEGDENIDSSDESQDEEILRNFNDKAQAIVQVDTLPAKSGECYVLVYETYQILLNRNSKYLSDDPQKNMIVYFNELKERLKPPTQWSIYSMLRKTISANQDIDIETFINLKSLIKNNVKGYVPTKAHVFTWANVMEFMNNAPDLIYSAAKVILILGICGCLRCDETTNLKVTDVEDLGNNKNFLVSIRENKNDYPGQFVVGSLFYDKVKQYIMLRPAVPNKTASNKTAPKKPDQFSDRFFIQYSNGKCTCQNMGKHKIGEVPFKVATFLNLDEPKRYTGHCFRRTSATLLSNSGANMQLIKQLGRWRSDIVAQGYIENSLHNKHLIYQGIITNTNQPTVDNDFARPSTSGIISKPSLGPNSISSASIPKPAEPSAIPAPKPSISTSKSTKPSASPDSTPSTSTLKPANPQNPELIQSSSTHVDTAHDELESNVYELDWADFAEDFSVIDQSNSTNVRENNFTRASLNVFTKPRSTNSTKPIFIKPFLKNHR